MKKIFLIVILAGIFSGAHAQGTWSYEDCINYALENNLRLNTFSFDEERQRLNYKSAINNFLPSISASSNYEVREGRSLDPETNGYTDNKNFQNSYGVNAELLLFNGFRQQNLLSFERYRLRATREEYERQQNDVAFLVINAYVTHLANEGLVSIQEEQLDVSEREVHRITKRIELGLASGSDLYEAQARQAADEYLMVQYQNQLSTSEFDLKRLMNLPMDTLLALEGLPDQKEEYVPFSADSLLDIAEDHLPQIQSTTALLEASRKQVSAARSALTPSLGVYGSWGTSYFGAYDSDIIDFNTQFKNNRQLRYGIALNIPLFDAFRRRNNVQQTKINREQAENDLKIALQDLEYEINKAIRDWHGAIAEFESAQKNEQSMTLAFEVAEKKREKGLISIMDFYEAKNNLSTARAEMLRTELQLFLRERIINFYLTGSLAQ